jgi:hypothetical protein
MSNEANAVTTNNAPSVTFDVGGTIYKISRSLIEQYPDTMLARMVSDTWLKGDQKEPLFIDRNGERFQYCLDYMRDGPVVALPFTIPKDALLKELEYYGFDSVDPNQLSIGASNAGFMASMENLNALGRKKEMNAECAMLAHYIFLRFKDGGTLVIYFFDGASQYADFHGRPGNNKKFYQQKVAELRQIADSLRQDTEKTACFNAHLKECGIKFKCMDSRFKYAMELELAGAD